jgi:prepilin-type N-terminal cleavage/methylation domain-containing protein
MFSPRGRLARAFTLIELLIVIAIIGILIAAIAVAVTKSKEIAWQTMCGSNMKQVMEAMNTFHEYNGCYPTYNGVFPVGSTTQFSGNPRAVYGGWFTHLLPYTENKALHDIFREECAKYTNASGNVTIGGGVVVEPAVPGYYDPPRTLISPRVTQTITEPNPDYPGPTTTAYGNNYSYTTPTTISPTITRTIVIKEAVYDPPDSKWIPGKPAVLDPPVPEYRGPIGVWKHENRRTVFKVLLCPSDAPVSPQAGDGLVYRGSTGTATSAWGATNYLANWNAITNGDVKAGYQAAPGNRSLVEDGPANTIFLAEAYSWCEGKGRTALLAWHPKNVNDTGYEGVHNFGLTFPMGSITFGGSTTNSNMSVGLPNPSMDHSLNFGFQIQPLQGVSGANGCISLTVQSPHSSLNVAMGDNSIRRVREEITSDQWRALMLPKDGGAPPSLD